MESHNRSDFDSATAELRLEELEARARRANGGSSLPLRDWVAMAEAWRIAQALRETRGNRSAAARALGIGRRTLYSKMEKLGLEPVWMVSAGDPNGAAVSGPNGAAVSGPNGAAVSGPNGAAVPGANGSAHDGPEA